MSWNHRVLKHKYLDNLTGKEEEYFAIHEVFYRGYKPTACTKDPIDLSSETMEDLKWQINKIKQCLKKPILNYEDFGKKSKKEKI